MFQLTSQSLRKLWFAGLASLVALSLQANAGLAQAGEVHLPMVNRGLATTETPAPEPPDEHTEEEQTEEEQAEEELIDEEQVEAELLAEAERLLPEPALLRIPPSDLPPNDDADGDGVPDAEDNCPFRPNPPLNGVQPDVCGKGLGQIIDNTVFLASRTFRPPEGLDPYLTQTQPRPRIHVLLHVIPNDNGVVLASSLRAALESHSVHFLDYLPHNTYYVSLPRNREHMEQLVAMPGVYGISALRPPDRIAPQIRVQGPVMGRNADGTLSVAVDFFEDAPPQAIETLLAQLALDSEHQDDQSYHVTVADWHALRRLAIQDIVYWIDDLPDPLYNRTQNAQALIGGQSVNNALGYRGQGIVVSMVELALFEPLAHPDLAGRVTHGNNPIFSSNNADFIDHAQKVAAIMVADETTFPERAGLLPEAELISYSATGGLTIKAQHFGVNREAREDYAALVSNYSWGPLNCNKRGEYSKRGKFFDRSVHEVGITVVYAAGNGRGPNGDFAGKGCQSDLYSLPHPVAKNDISVGNWDISAQAIAASSSAGPAADGRLKPDLVAPGQGINTIDWNETGLYVEPVAMGGTSAAAPVTAGVIGWMGESFRNQSENILTISPARFKAILVHTAQDVGPPGPDYKHGYGLIQAERALRIAEEWSLWGREGTLDENTRQLIFPFDVDTPMTFYKATLAWDDEKGTESSTLALKNDLDLTLVSPSGVTFYPYDIQLPVGNIDNGSVPCTDPSCQDRLNNVEMVVVEPAAGFVEPGTWQAVVTFARLASDQQTFSLVLTPPCPVVIKSTVTLPRDIECEPHPLEPSAVIIQADNVGLDCDGHRIFGGDAGVFGFDGSHVGIRVLGNNVTVRNCDIRQFDVGIKVGQETDDDSDKPTIAPINAQLLRNRLMSNGSAAIELIGGGHTADGNEIGLMRLENGVGVSVRGDNMILRDNFFNVARAAGPNDTIGILVHPDLNWGWIEDNIFEGNWRVGIRLYGLEESSPVDTFFVERNQFEGIEAVPIELLGDVRNTQVAGNQLLAYGGASPGIRVVGHQSFGFPKNNTITANFVQGTANQGQLGIVLLGAENSQVTGNTLRTVAVGISDDHGTNTRIHDNGVSLSVKGIHVDNPVGAAIVTANTINVSGVGIAVGGAWAPQVNGNGITADITGIALSDAPRAVVRGNTLFNPAMVHVFSGIVVDKSDETLVTENDITGPSVGVMISATVEISVAANSIDNPGVAGIALEKDTRGRVDRNTITNNNALGIHYRTGLDAVLSNNSITSFITATGIRLGTGDPKCPVNVDNILVEHNVLIGSIVGIEVMCDVGTHTLNGN